MNTGWVRLGSILVVFLVPGGFAGVVFWKHWAKRIDRTRATEVIAPINSAAPDGYRRNASQTGVPRLIGPPYLYTENLIRLS